MFYIINFDVLQDEGNEQAKKVKAKLKGSKPGREADETVVEEEEEELDLQITQVHNKGRKLDVEKEVGFNLVTAKQDYRDWKNSHRLEQEVTFNDNVNEWRFENSLYFPGGNPPVNMTPTLDVCTPYNSKHLISPLHHISHTCRKITTRINHHHEK